MGFPVAEYIFGELTKTLRFFNEISPGVIKPHNPAQRPSGRCNMNIAIATSRSRRPLSCLHQGIDIFPAHQPGCSWICACAVLVGGPRE